MVTLITVIHYVVCIFMIIIILVQHGKGADMGATFGGASQTVFGSRGATTFLHKLTVGAAVTMFMTSLSLAYISSQKSTKSIFSDKATDTQSVIPATSESPKAETKSDAKKSNEAVEKPAEKSDTAKTPEKK